MGKIYALATREWLVLVLLISGPILFASSQQTCGNAPPVAQGRVVGGQQAYSGQIPWQVSLQAYGTHYCGGAILSDRWIVTAGHCAASMAQQPSQLKLVIGALEVNRYNPYLQALPEQHFSADLIIFHENFNRKLLLFDIALIRLNGQIQFNSQAQPICLPLQEEEFLGSMGLVSGWGKTNENDVSPSPLLNFLFLPIISNPECQQMYGMRSPPLRLSVKSEWVCAGFRESGRDACQGDSGGPLAAYQNGIWKLVGITSGGFGCARAYSPGVFTRVSKFVTWINQKVVLNS